MSFKSEGTYPVKIVKAELAEPKFATPPAFDICLQVQTEDGQTDWWRGEVSGKYGRGNASDRTQAQLTMETLQKIGFQGNDVTTIGTLVGVQTTATAVASEKNGKTYINVRYLGDAGDAPVAIDPRTIANRMAQIFGAPVQHQAPQQAYPQQAQAWQGQPVQQQQAPAPGPWPAQGQSPVLGQMQGQQPMPNPFGR